MTAVDVWAQHVTERFMSQPWLDTLIRWTGMSQQRPTVGQALAAMDECDVGVALLAGWHGPQGSLISNEEVAATVEQQPDRFRGVVGVDLTDPMGAVREIRRRVGEGFVGVRVVPWLWNLPPNDRRYYPVYAACVDAGVPFCTQIGHTGPLCPSEPGRTRVMFGTNWPMLSPARALERLDDLGLDDEARDLFLGGNARRVFEL